MNLFGFIGPDEFVLKWRNGLVLLIPNAFCWLCFVLPFLAFLSK